MLITEFLAEPLFQLPKIQPAKADFKQTIFKQLDTFLENLRGVSAINQTFQQLEDYPLFRLVERQEHLVSKIKASLNAYYDGRPYEAYEHLKNGLSDVDVKDFFEVLNIKTYQPRCNFYRVRVHKENYPLGSNEFFHIPFEKRGLVKTQRFSIPGFPSLYLGNSLYVCWEELGRPNLNDFQAVRLVNTTEIQVIDLSPPAKDEADMYEWYKQLMTWPLILSCLVKVRDKDAAFKPEYIIPQLLLQWVRQKPGVDGIAYRTTHINPANNLSEGEFINLVLPVKDNKASGLCSTLRVKFEISNASSIQLMNCETGGMTFLHNSAEINGLNPNIRKLEMIKGRTFPYGYSILGELERTLSYMQVKKISSN